MPLPSLVFNKEPQMSSLDEPTRRMFVKYGWLCLEHTVVKRTQHWNQNLLQSNLNPLHLSKPMLLKILLPIPLPSMVHQFLFFRYPSPSKISALAPGLQFPIIFSLVIHLILPKKALKNQCSKSESSSEGWKEGDRLGKARSLLIG